eukprot:4448745-Pleurochrysis_carterae.AAC.4
MPLARLRAPCACAPLARACPLGVRAPLNVHVPRARACHLLRVRASPSRVRARCTFVPPARACPSRGHAPYACLPPARACPLRMPVPCACVSVRAYACAGAGSELARAGDLTRGPRPSVRPDTPPPMEMSFHTHTYF